MINIIKEEIEIEESLESRLRVICDFCNTTPTIINGSIRRIDKTNLTYIEPHRIYIKNNLYLAFNYSTKGINILLIITMLLDFFKNLLYYTYQFYLAYKKHWGGKKWVYIKKLILL